MTLRRILKRILRRLFTKEVDCVQEISAVKGLRLEERHCHQGYFSRRLTVTGSHSFSYRGPLLAGDLIMIHERVIPGAGADYVQALFGVCVRGWLSISFVTRPVACRRFRRAWVGKGNGNWLSGPLEKRLTSVGSHSFSYRCFLLAENVMVSEGVVS
jgi:hypothetical protein